MSLLPVDHETIDRLIEAAVPVPAVDQQGPTLADKVELLSRPGAYPGYQGEVARRETHMSWVFLTRNRAYKLKKPVRFPYLDFSTLALREAACRAEIRLNRRLAPDVYLGVVPVTWSATALSVGDGGDIVDWLVVMRRLDEITDAGSGARRTPREGLADRPAGGHIGAILSSRHAGFRLAREASRRLAGKPAL